MVYSVIANDLCVGCLSPVFGKTYVFSESLSVSGQHVWIADISNPPAVWIKVGSSLGSTIRIPFETVEELLAAE
jgi:hypothetical protein